MNDSILIRISLYQKQIRKFDLMIRPYDDVSAGMGRIYYKGFSENEIAQFESYLERIQKNLEGWREE